MNFWHAPLPPLTEVNDTITMGDARAQQADLADVGLGLLYGYDRDIIADLFQRLLLDPRKYEPNLLQEDINSRQRDAYNALSCQMGVMVIEETAKANFRDRCITSLLPPHMGRGMVKFDPVQHVIKVRNLGAPWHQLQAWVKEEAKRTVMLYKAYKVLDLKCTTQQWHLQWAFADVFIFDDIHHIAREKPNESLYVFLAAYYDPADILSLDLPLQAVVVPIHVPRHLHNGQLLFSDLTCAREALARGESLETHYHNLSRKLRPERAVIELEGTRHIRGDEGRRESRRARYYSPSDESCSDGSGGQGVWGRER